ncbi:discoidin domain-containing protein [Streptomyces sp. NPDC054802]
MSGQLPGLKLWVRDDPESCAPTGDEPGQAVDGQTGHPLGLRRGRRPQWLAVDLGTTAALSRVRLDWEAAYASAYGIQSSADGTSWTDLASFTSGDGGTDELAVTGNARYVRATQCGYSLYEFKVYGTTGAPSPSPTPTPTPIGRGVSPGRHRLIMD